VSTRTECVIGARIDLSALNAGQRLGQPALDHLFHCSLRSHCTAMLTGLRIEELRSCRTILPRVTAGAYPGHPRLSCGLSIIGGQVHQFHSIEITS
jgi:hypothetical protein